MIETVWELVAMLGAAGIATLLRFWDFPLNKIVDVDLVTGISTLLGALIASFFAVWAGNLDPTIWEQFTLVVIAAIGGMGGVRALFTVQTQVRAEAEAKKLAKQ